MGEGGIWYKESTCCLHFDMEALSNETKTSDSIGSFISTVTPSYKSSVALSNPISLALLTVNDAVEAEKFLIKDEPLSLQPDRPIVLSLYY